MKKLVISMFVIAMASSTVVNAASFTPQIPMSTVIAEDQEKVEVKPEDLPEPVKATLGAEPYNEWKVEKAYSVTSANGDQYFEISLSKGEDTATVNLDKDGKKVE